MGNRSLLEKHEPHCKMPHGGSECDCDRQTIPAKSSGLRLYTGDEVHGFTLPDYRSSEPRWIDAKTGLIPLVNAIAAMDCVRDEPNCGSCLSCQAKTLIGESVK